MTEHTPVPWYALGWGITAEPGNIRRQVAFCVPIPPLSEREDNHMLQASNEEQRANARFIVRACNSHDEMLAALEVAIHALEHQRMVNQSHEDVVALGQARAAIAAAKGGKS